MSASIEQRCELAMLQLVIEVQILCIYLTGLPSANQVDMLKHSWAILCCCIIAILLAAPINNAVMLIKAHVCSHHHHPHPLLPVGGE